VVTTGDDAIELVAKRRGAGDANGLGVCVRVSDYSGVAEDQVRTLGRVLAALSARLDAELVPIPISAHPDERDLDVIREVLGARGEDAADGAIDTPRAAIDRAARCRVVVTGSYHAGVFALAQGVPAIGLAASSYYVDKFLGLRDQFGDGCTPIMLDADDLAGALEAAIEEAWAQDPGLRAQLVAAGERQLEAGRAAYNRLFEIVESARR
jgi:colanic acid/amylovoran biosynthesis protein